MAVMSLLGPAVGPISGGYLSKATGWRWTFWLVTILIGFQEIAFAILYRETYEPIILQRKAKSLRPESAG